MSGNLSDSSLYRCSDEGDVERIVGFHGLITAVYYNPIDDYLLVVDEMNTFYNCEVESK